MNKLHSTQQSLLELLDANIDDPLTIRELQEQLNLSTPSLVAHHIQQLEKKGYLKRSPSNPQDYQLLKQPEKQLVHLNLYGIAQCGPEGSILEGNIVDRIPISTKLLSFPAEEAFLVKAKGESMMPLINEGDLVIVRRSSTADDGKVVVCVNDGKTLIKKFHKDNASVVLESANSGFPPFIAKDDFRIEGEVKGVISAFA
jgi:repressor LexA